MECKNPRCSMKIREMEEELDRLRSVGYDLLKQRGKWQATGMNPVDLGLEFASIFTHDVEDLSEALINDTDMPGSQVRKFLCNTFQDVYMGCKETILDRMRTALSRVLVLPEEHESDEDLYDICRAYGLLLNVCSKSKAYDHQVSFTKACDNLTISIEKKVEDITKKMSEFSWKILETVPPMVSTTVSDTLFCKDWHEKEMSPEWNEELENYDLEYYRPVLFFSYEGKVSQKGWVGNTPASVDSVTAKEFCLKSYKKPCLKVKQMASLGSASEQSKFDPDPSTSDVPGTKETYDKSANQTDQDTPSSGYLIGLRKYT